MSEIKPCSVNGCDKKLKSKLYCSMHQARLDRTGRLDKKRLAERIKENIEYVNDCWEWQGYKSDEGYGIKSRSDFIKRDLSRYTSQFDR